MNNFHKKLSNLKATVFSEEEEEGDYCIQDQNDKSIT